MSEYDFNINDLPYQGYQPKLEESSYRYVESEPFDLTVDHFTVSCLVAWPLNESEAGGDLVLIETSPLFSC